MLFFIVFLAFYLAWNLGANDVANSMGTSVGSKAISLKQAIIIAGILEFVGAVFFGENVASTLAINLTKNNLFSSNPNTLLWGMVSVLISSGLWLQIATFFGLPVASSHGVVGAIAGFSAAAIGFSAINWSQIGFLTLGWLFTPVLSGVIATIFYTFIQRVIFRQENPENSLNQWIFPLNVLIFSVFGVIVFPTILDRPFFHHLPLPIYSWGLLGGGIASLGLTIALKNELFSLKQGEQGKNEVKTEIKVVETILGRFQVISAGFVAFAHGSNDVGNAVAPLAAIAYILKNNAVPLTEIAIPLWVLIVGGVGIVAGLAVQGKKVIGTVGEGIINLQPSKGLAAELATATTILLASRWGLPVSTSHALVGGVVGIGLLNSSEKVNLGTLKNVVLAWVITIPATAMMAALIFYFLRVTIIQQ